MKNDESIAEEIRRKSEDMMKQLKQTVDEFMDSELQSQNPLKNSD